MCSWDNYYGCFAAAEFAFSSGIAHAATLKQGRADPSKAVTSLPKGAERGTLKVLKHKTKNQYISVWLDNKVVLLGCNYEFGIGSCKRKKKGSRTKGCCACPECMGMYNATMGSVDRGDQCNQFVRIKIRSHRNMRNYQCALLISGCTNNREM